MRDAWLLVGEAVAADLIPAARQLADRAVELSGWERYVVSTVVCGIQVRTLDLMPRGWAYHVRVRGREQLLLLNPLGRQFVTESTSFGPIMAGVYRTGGGLFRIDEVLGEVLADSVVSTRSPDR
jgi:hypothetical protein